MTLKQKKKTAYSTDEIKHTHRDSYKGHKTKKHFILAIEEEEAEQEIRNETLQDFSADSRKSD